MGGKLLDTGSYVIYAIPGKEYWDIILNKGLTNWGTDGYKESEDVVHIKVKPQKINISVETLTIIFGDILPESCNLTILWGSTAVIVPISTNIRTRLRAQIEKDLSADNVKPAVFQSAANFYLEWDKDLVKALANAKKATAANPKAFYLFLLQAKIEKEAGDKMAAKISAQKCIDLAIIAKNDDYVKQATDLINKL
jgi:hypothetical protein